MIKEMIRDGYMLGFCLGFVSGLIIVWINQARSKERVVRREG